MSFSPFSDNDDDLFSESTTSSFEQSFPQDIQSLIDNTDKDKPKDDTEYFSSILSNGNLIINLLDSSNTFLFQTTSHTRTIFNTLNYLTDNKFQYDLYADILEESLFRKFLIFDFLTVCLNQVDENDYNILNQLTSLNINRQFVLTYFQSYHNMLNHSINYNINLYTKVCSVINRSPVDTVINRTIDSDQFALISSNTYINNVFSNIKNTLLNDTQQENFQ